MTSRTGYGQYCPIAVTAEILCERWTPLVIRAICCGATRYSEIRQSVPRMSTALLSRRLSDLQAAGVVEKTPDREGKGHDYTLTDAGRELFPVLEAMGFWSQRWLRREITHEKNLDPDILMWELRRTGLNAERSVADRRVVEFRISGVEHAKQRYWLVFEPDDVDICARDPGFPVSLWVSGHIRTLVEVWLGHRTLRSAIDENDLRLDGDRSEISAFPDWFSLSMFANE